MNDIIIIFLFIVFLGVGAAVGYLISSLRRGSQGPSAADGTPALPGSTEVLRVWRMSDGQLQLWMDGQQLANPAALSPETRRRLVDLLIDLRPWLVGAPEPAAGQEAAAVPAVQPTPMAPAAKKPDEKAAPKPPPIIKTIVQQINDVLQAKLEGTALKERDIEMLDGEMGAVIVRIGLNKYVGIDAVPDPEIQALIRLAVTDWEKGSK